MLEALIDRQDDQLPGSRKPAVVQYAGGAPGVVAGIAQLKVQVPSGVSGSVPLVVTINDASSQPGVTVAVAN